MKEELKHKLIIRGSGRDQDPDNPELSSQCYYVLDLITCEVSSSIPLTQTPYIVGGSTFFVGSKLFIIGDDLVGDLKYDDDDNKCPLYSFDLMSKPEQGWKRSPSPLTPISYWKFQVAEFGGKIYVFRGSEDDCLCEVFDPQSNEWSYINSPPGPGHKTSSKVEYYISGPVLPDHRSNRLIVWFENISELFAYYPNEDRWECVAQEFQGWDVDDDQQVTLNDGVIYFCDEHCYDIAAFHIASKQWFDVCLPIHFDLERGNFDIRSLLNRGNGSLCLVGYDLKPRRQGCYDYDNYDLIVCAIELKVTCMNETDKQIVLTFLCSKNFFLDRCHMLHLLLV